MINGEKFTYRVYWQSMRGVINTGILIMTALTLLGMNPSGQEVIMQSGDTITNVPTVVNSGSYNDLSNLPIIPSIKYYNGSSATSIIAYTATTTTTSGSAVFNLVDGSSNAIFTNINYVKAEVSDATNSYNYSYTLTNSNKTLTISVMRSAPTGVIALLGLNLLSAPAATPNGTSVNVMVIGA